MHKVHKVIMMLTSVCLSVRSPSNFLYERASCITRRHSAQSIFEGERYLGVFFQKVYYLLVFEDAKFNGNNMKLNSLIVEYKRRGIQSRR